MISHVHVLESTKKVCALSIIFYNRGCKLVPKEAHKEKDFQQQQQQTVV